MKKYFIKQLILKGENKPTSTIEFSDKLTIITGPSNTGKSYILKIIDFVLGKGDLQIANDVGYTDFTLVLSLDNKDISLSRNIKSEVVVVDSDSPVAESGEYNIKIEAENSLNNLLLCLLGIYDVPKVPSNIRYEMRRLSHRVLLQSQLIFETEIERDSSIILPKVGENKTYYLSHLLFLLYATDFSIYDTQEDPKITKARKNAVKTYIQKKIANIEKQLHSISTEQENISQNNIDSADALYAQLDNINNDIQQAIKQAQSLLKDISGLSNSITECDLQIKSYEALKTQYISDINRLSFGLEATDGLHKAITAHGERTCPFCNSKFEQDDILGEDVDAINNEVTKITNQLNDLLELIDELREEKKGYAIELKEKQDEQTKIENLINKDLKVKKINIEKQVEYLKSYMELKAQLEVFQLMANECNQDLIDLDKKVKRKKTYRPIDIFEKDFEITMTETIQKLLKFCNNSFFAKSYFDLKQADIVINGQPKSINGKGYKAFYNTVVVLALRHCLNDLAIYKPTFYIIDTPLHGLDQGESEKDENKSLRKRLYTYFVDTMKDTQLIIIDNDENLPKDFNFDIEGIKKIEFTKDDSKGKYGLFEGFRE